MRPALALTALPFYSQLSWSASGIEGAADAAGGLEVSRGLEVSTASLDTPVEVWFQDEMRVGRRNKLPYRWARKGSRPRAAHDQRTQLPESKSNWSGAMSNFFGPECAQGDLARILPLPPVFNQRTAIVENVVIAPVIFARLPNVSLIIPPLRSTAVIASCGATWPWPTV